MKKIEKLTAEQEALLLNHVKEWADLSTPLNREKATEYVKWLYAEAKLKEPIVVFVSSPLACQYAIPIINGYLKALKRGKRFVQVGAQVRDQVGDQVGAQVGAQAGAQVGAQVWDQVGDQVRAQAGAQVWDQVGDQVWDQVRAQVRAQVKKEKLSIYSFANHGSIWDYGWCSFFFFFKEVGVVQHDKFNEFIKLKETGLYDMIQLDGLCVVCEMPKYIKRDDQHKMHNISGPSIEWSDGYKLWFYHGIAVPQHWVENANSITKDEVIKESNAEKRRALRDLMGIDRYYDVLGGVIEVDRDADDQGNEMVLYESKVPDSVVNRKIQYLEVICPSTGRKYVLYPPDHCTNVWQAKASTFCNEKIMYRHGDVGLRNIEKAFDRPICES